MKKSHELKNCRIYQTWCTCHSTIRRNR